MQGRMFARVERHAFDPLSEVHFGPPAVAHGAEIHGLVGTCAPLDLNSQYAYLLLCAHHADTCVRADRRGKTVGFVSAYLVPDRPDTLFVWQVAVAAQMRGRGLAARMLRELLERDAIRGCRYLETTVTPSNLPSRRLFQALAGALNAPLRESLMFSRTQFGAGNHEAEMLFRIGPINHSTHEETTR